MYASLYNVFFGYNHFQSLSNVYHYIFLILLQYLYITGYTPFGCPGSFCCCIKFVFNFILFLKLRKLHLLRPQMKRKNIENTGAHEENTTYNKH